MEYLVVIIVCIIFLLILKFAWKIRIKDILKIKEIGYSKELNEITNKLPDDREICKDILKRLNNDKVNIKEDGATKTSLYIAISDTILIANIKETFTRVQTIAHECLHSVQNRRTLLFNFVFSNIYIIYFLAICILSIFKVIQNGIIYLFILTILSFIYYAIRSYIEIDAMTKASPLVKEYIEESNVLSQEELNKILESYDKINEIGIKTYAYKLIINCTIKIVILSSIMQIMQHFN